MVSSLIENRVREVFGKEGDNALRVMRCESGGNPGSVGDHWLPSSAALRLEGDYGDSVGLFQIRLLKGRPDRGWLMVPENNIRYAHAMWERQGWGPWSCKKVLK